MASAINVQKESMLDGWAAVDHVNLYQYPLLYEMGSVDKVDIVMRGKAVGILETILQSTLCTKTRNVRYKDHFKQFSSARWSLLGVVFWKDAAIIRITY